ncbi:MAG: type 4a pilus biogenesis protein PilO [Peptostreptococcaceae bacterium]
MKISKRDKILLVVLAFVIICLGYYKLVYVNQYAKLQGLKEEEVALQEEYNTMSANIETITKNKEEIKSLNYSIGSKSMLLYPKLYQDRIILEVNNLLKEAGIKGNLSFSDITVAPVEPYFLTEGEEDAEVQASLEEVAEEFSEEKTKEEGTATSNSDKDQTVEESKPTEAISEEKFVEQMKVSVSFSGTYSNVMKFIKSMSEYDRLVAMSNITLAASGEDAVSGTLDLEFYSIPKLDEKEDSEYLKWPYVENYGKDNPFIEGSSASNSSSKSGEKAYELLMSIKSINSDLPSITMGRDSDLTKETYLYNDENKKIDVEIQVSKEGGKYYIKYKTPKSSYPSNYNEMGVELKNIEGDIAIGVYSSARIDVNDKVGANIKVINNTDKNVSLTIIDDDKMSPRVQITPEGKVEYVNK